MNSENIIYNTIFLEFFIKIKFDPTIKFLIFLHNLRKIKNIFYYRDFFL